MRTSFAPSEPIGVGRLHRLAQRSAVTLRRWFTIGAALVLWFWPGLRAETWTLEQALRHVQTQSPDAQLAHHRVAAAQAALQQAKAAYWPQLQANASYFRTDHPVTVFGMALNQQSVGGIPNYNDVPDADNFNVQGVVRVPIYQGGRNAAARKSAAEQAQATGHEEAAVRSQLALETARTYYAVIKARHFVRAAEAAVQAYEGNAANARKREAAGAALKTEVLDMEVRLAQAREDLVRTRNGATLTLRALRNLLGLETRDFEIADEAPALPVPQTEAAAQRPELRAARASVVAAEARVRGARAGYLPRVSAVGSLDHNQGWEFDGSGESYTAGVLAQWEVWDGQLTRARVSEAQAGLALAREQERKILLALDLELEQARLNLQEATERLAVTDKSVAQATESAELTRSRFEQGLVLGTQLIDAETAATAARVRRAEAEADQRVAVAGLRRALGLPLLP